MAKSRDPSKPTSTERATLRDSKKPPAIDKLLYPCLIICAVSILFALARSVLYGGGIAVIDTSDSLLLRSIFFGEEESSKSYKGSHVILCHTPDDTSTQPLNSAFVDASKIIDGKLAKFSTIDCLATLPSGTSIREKFNIDTTKRPAAVFISGGRLPSPKQVATADLKSGVILSKAIRSMLEPRSAKIESSKQLKSRCLSTPYCLLLMKGSESINDTLKSTIKALITEIPEVQFAHVDSSVLEMNLERKMGAFERGVERVVMFRRVDEEDDDNEEDEVGGEDDEDGETKKKKAKKSKNKVGEDRLMTSAKSYKPATANDLSLASLRAFINESIDDPSSFKLLPATPKLNVRTKKKNEQAKKARAKSGNGGVDPGPSKEERKAERERQRDRAKKEREQSMSPEEIETERVKFEAEKRGRLEEEMRRHVIEEEDEEEGGDEEDEEEEEEIEDLD